jgi:putative transposase
MLTEARTANAWLRAGSSVPQQQRAGMPKYKRKHAADPTLNHTQRGFRLKGGRLHLAGGIVLSVVWSRDLPEPPSSVRVYRDSVGHWYASFVVAATVEAMPATGRVIGIDGGVKETATTTSDAHDLPHAQHAQQAQHAQHGKNAAQRLAHGQEGRT